MLAGGATGQERILTRPALEFVAELQRQFGPTRDGLLQRRAGRRAELASGASLTVPPGTANVREGAWTVAPAPRDLTDRRVEITGPVDRKMMINALNSGASAEGVTFSGSVAVPNASRSASWAPST